MNEPLETGSIGWSPDYKTPDVMSEIMSGLKSMADKEDISTLSSDRAAGGEAMRWISVDHNLPQIVGRVLISSRWGKVFLGQRQFLGTGTTIYYWWTAGQLFNKQDVLAWMPLPEPYLADADKALADVASEPRGDSAAKRGLRELQAEQVPWVKHNFGDRPSWMPLLGAVEELGELAHAHLKKAQGIRVSENHTEKTRDAVADIIIYLADYASASGFDLQSVVMKTWDKVRQRDWKKNPADADNPEKLREVSRLQSDPFHQAVHTLQTEGLAKSAPVADAEPQGGKEEV